MKHRNLKKMYDVERQTRRNLSASLKKKNNIGRQERDNSLTLSAIIGKLPTTICNIVKVGMLLN